MALSAKKAIGHFNIIGGIIIIEWVFIIFTILVFELSMQYFMHKQEPTMQEIQHDLCAQSTGNAGCDQTNSGSISKQ